MRLHCICTELKLGAKLIRSLRLLWLLQGRSYYKGAGGTQDSSWELGELSSVVSEEVAQTEGGHKLHECPTWLGRKITWGHEIYLVPIHDRTSRVANPSPWSTVSPQDKGCGHITTTSMLHKYHKKGVTV